MPNLSERTVADRLLRPKQVQAMLGVVASTLWNYKQAGLIEPAQNTAGGHARYLESEVVALRAKLTAKRARVPAEVAA